MPSAEIRSVRFPDGSTLVGLAVEPRGGGLYQVVEHPLVSEFCGLDDVIEVLEEADGTLRFHRVVGRGPWRTLAFIFTPDVLESEEFERLVAAAEREGARWDRAFGGVFWLHLRRGHRGPAARALLRRIGELRRASRVRDDRSSDEPGGAGEALPGT